MIEKVNNRLCMMTYLPLPRLIGYLIHTRHQGTFQSAGPFSLQCASLPYHTSDDGWVHTKHPPCAVHSTFRFCHPESIFVLNVQSAGTTQFYHSKWGRVTSTTEHYRMDRNVLTPALVNIANPPLHPVDLSHSSREAAAAKVH